MADPQRTHKATPKRVREFRKRGEIALSRDLVSAATLTGGVIALVACSGMAATAVMGLMRDATTAGVGHTSSAFAGDALRCFLVSAAPIMIAAAVAATLAILGQLGWPPALHKMKLDFGRMSPLKNLGKTFALGAMTKRSGAALAKLVVVGAVVVLALQHGFATHAMDVAHIGAVAWSTLSHALWLVLGALILIGAVDYFLARRKMGGQMRMTFDEVKRENRESEGDPVVRGRRKSRMRELAKRRIAFTVAKADVVVVNPTHYAVALRYDESTDRAPIVVAKGADEMAEKIREVARKHGVPVLSRPPLARALHKHVKEGRAIPANLFRAVAEVLAYVYRLRGEAGSR